MTPQEKEIRNKIIDLANDRNWQIDVESLMLLLTPYFKFESVDNVIDKIKAMQDHGAREGCTYGDTKHDSVSACYGYNLALDNVVEVLSNPKSWTVGVVSKGAKMIADERREQIYKHKRTLEHDVYENNEGQLIYGAIMLLTRTSVKVKNKAPYNWNQTLWSKMLRKPYKDRLIVAGALIAAEIDGIVFLEEIEKNPWAGKK